MNKKEKYIRKVFLDHLDRHGKTINWINSVGKIVHFIYDDIEGDILIKKVYRVNKITMLTVSYLENSIDMSSTFFQKCTLGKLLNKITKEFKIEIGTRFKDDKRDITIIDREYRCKESIDKQGRKSVHNQKWYKYKCNKCGWTESWIIEGSLLRSRGCGVCSGSKLIKGINDIATTFPQLVKYFKNIEDAYTHTNGCGDKILLICPDCGHEKEMIISNFINRDFSCDKCSDKISYPNKFAYKILEELKVDFKTEYSPKWCKYLFKNKIRKGRYDFYFKFNDKEYILEMDGGFHNNDNTMTGKTAEDSKFIDDEKDRLAKEHNIEVIRIDCDYGSDNRFEYIKYNISNNVIINELFDISNMNWLQCNEFACNNLLKLICEYRINNPNITAPKIAKIMKLSAKTINMYLTRGNELNFCYYNAKEELQKSSSINGINTGKPIKCIEANICFNSATECEKYSIGVFGIKMTRSGISLSIKENRKYKNYTFNHITREEYECYLKNKNE